MGRVCDKSYGNPNYGKNFDKMEISIYIIPIVIAFVVVYAVVRKVDVFAEFTKGVKEGVIICYDIFPSLFALVIGVTMLRSSGGIDAIGNAVAPIVGRLGIPKDVIPLALLRPFSGSGATALFEDLLNTTGADSFAGRVASVMLGSSETTFYTIAVYFAATKVRKTGAALPSALFGDALGFVLSTLAVRMFFYN
ncbi:spore maturation protein [Clostridia bacterium]|nr:spore maturation protein [Clostridia bacterium]